VSGKWGSLQGLGVEYHLAHLSKIGVAWTGLGWAVGWPGGPVISHGGVCAMEYRHAIAFSGDSTLSICQEVVVSHHHTMAIHLPDFPTAFCLSSSFFGEPRRVGLCRSFHFVIINLIDLDFNSFILEQLAKMLLAQKVYARLVSPIFRPVSIQIYFRQKFWLNYWRFIQIALMVNAFGCVIFFVDSLFGSELR